MSILDTLRSKAVKQPLLEADRLSKRYENGVLALDDVSFTVGTGEIHALLGGNGAGKTTLINLFLNFIEPSSGEARIAGFPSHTKPLLAKRYVAYVSENVLLYPNFTAMQNVDFFSRLAGRVHYTQADYRRVLLRVGLQEEAHHRRLKSFSKGMRQKCGIAIAILKDAAAILLDEPTSGLDPGSAFDFVDLLRELRNEDRAILMSTHDIFRAREVADTVGIMNEGRLVMKKSSADLAKDDLESIYLHYMGRSGEVV